MTNKLSELDFFSGGVPAGMMLKVNIQNLVDVFNSHDESDEKFFGGLNIASDICIIGLVAYFEAFCKGNFASVINICPELLYKFINQRDDITIPLSAILQIDDHLKNKLGFILSEKFDFGPPRAINSIYFDLLNITPFSKKESKESSELLRIRNLIVHHGGIFTLKSIKQKYKDKIDQRQIYFDSIVITKNDFQKWTHFIEKNALNICQATYKSTINFINDEKINLNSIRKKALEFIQSFDY